MIGLKRPPPCKGSTTTTNMEQMFYGASRFNSDLSAWNVSQVMSMRYMFAGAKSFDGDLSAWNVARVTHMGGIFCHCPAQRPSWYK